MRHTVASTLSSAPPPPDQDETCPVCKTTRYFNKDMEFRINPECYHRMCKTCVERIFKDGPNQCPYAGCHKTLRLRGFKSAFFADLTVEREVDIRRRVAAVFNKAEDDFETLEAYNDYLYMVECLTDDMVNGSDDARRKADAQLAEWEAQHRADIERNRRLARESDEARARRVAAEEEAARQRRLLDRQADADERANAAKMREEVLDSLASSEVGRATEAMNKIRLKKRGQQRRDAALDAAATATGGTGAAGPGGLSIRGLRDRKAAAAAAIVDDKPYSPHGGLRVAPERVDVSAANLAGYSNEWVEATRTKTDFRAGGYSPDEYLSRALFEAFSGLGVFVCEEKPDRGVSTAGAREVVAAGGKMDLDDPF